MNQQTLFSFTSAPTGSKTSQHDMILDHLKAGNSLTVAEALTKYGIYANNGRTM